LLLGLALGIFARPDSVYDSFYDMLFRGLLSILMLVMGMEAYARLSELRNVAHAYIAYGLIAPLLHGALGFGAGLVIHQITGFSAGGVVLLAVMASSSSDISGPPTMRGALPEANPSAYVGTSTGLGTPIAILSIPLWMALANLLIGP
ncbi:MAG: sodium-dependent bicarbonate transport family permease, partial [Pseudomonadota bacterium]